MTFLRPSPRRQQVEFALLVLLAVLITWNVTRNAARDTLTERLAVARQEAQAYQDSLAGQKARTDALQARTVASERLVRTMRSRLTARGASVDTALTSARTILEDSLATTADLRQQLSALSSLTQAYKYSADQYAVTVDSLLVKLVSERAAWEKERTYNVHTLAAKDSVIVALEAKRCRLLFFSCPSRVVSATLGGAAVLVTVLVVTASTP